MNRRGLLKRVFGIATGLMLAIVPSRALSKTKKVPSDSDNSNSIIFAMDANGGEKGFKPKRVLFNDDTLWRAWAEDPSGYGGSLYATVIHEGNAIEVDMSHKGSIVYVEVPKGTRFLALHFLNKAEVI